MDGGQTAALEVGQEPRERSRRLQRHGPLLMVLLASAASWALLFALIPPSHQEFPLVDDWAFAEGAYRFAAGGGIDYRHWASMPLLGQWVWSAPFVWTLGPHYFAMRLSTIVLSMLGLSAFHDLLRQEGTGTRMATFVTAALAFHPLFYLLQGTYMTDVPALSFGMMALALYGRAFGRASTASLLAAIGCALLAVTTRQNMMVIPLVAAVQLARSPQRWRLGSMLAVLVPLMVGVATLRWFDGRADAWHLQANWPPRLMIVATLYFIAVYSAAAAVPVLSVNVRPKMPKVFVVCSAVFLPIAIYWWAQQAVLPYGGLFPYINGILTPAGACSPKDNPGERPILLGQAARGVMTVLACLAAALLGSRIAERMERRWMPGPLFFFGLAQVPFLLLVPQLFDRYFLMFIPPALAAAIPLERGRIWVGLVVLAAQAVLSVGLMHDWLEWNSARWALGRQAVAQGIAATDIEGGLEWDAMNRPEALNLDPEVERPRRLATALAWAWFPYISGRYALSFSELPGARVVQTKEYSQWVPPARRTYYLLKDSGEPHP